MNPFLLRHLFFPIYHLTTGSGVIEKVKDFKNNQWLCREAILNLQKKKLSHLLCHAFENIPYYRRRFKAAGISLSDLQDPSVISCLPLLTKKEITENRSSMIAQNNPGGRLISNSTSGSTGEALYFYTDMRSWACKRAVVIRNHEWLGVHLGDREASLWGAPMDIQNAAKLRNKIHHWFNNYILLSSYDLSSRTLQEYIDRLNRFKPILLTSYPGPLAELAQFMIEKDLQVPSLRAIISSAETLYPWQRDISERAFACPVYNRYGCREFGDIAHECDRREGLHLNAEKVFLEILDENLEPCDKEKTGEIVITDLENYGMPLIRYRIGDRGSFSNKSCSCGRGLPLLESVEGRTLDVIRTPDGNALGGTFWTLLFRSRPGIKSFQVVQNTIDGINVHYVRDLLAPDVPIEYFVNKIREKCGMDFYITFHEVDRVGKTTSGKTRFVISNIKPEH
jgi:phenylacetate-CoA ligase